MRDRLSRSEIRKDAVQDTVEAAASAVGEVATILTRAVTGAVRDVAAAVGGFATEVYDIRDSARRAAADHESPPGRPGGPNG